MTGKEYENTAEEEVVIGEDRGSVWDLRKRSKEGILKIYDCNQGWLNGEYHPFMDTLKCCAMRARMGLKDGVSSLFSGVKRMGVRCTAEGIS